MLVYMKALLFLLLTASLLLTSQFLPAQDASQLIPAHDPVMAKQGDTYYLFCTGRGIAAWSSKDLKTWKKEPAVFAEPPRWAMEAVPGFKGHVWAPDISYYNGQYYLFYSVSAFGKNTSCIGLATNKTLDPSDTANYKWVDHGKIIQSFPGKTSWNAIDPNLVVDDKGNPWLAFGSFWDGLKMIRLNKDRMRVAGDLKTIPTIASRKQSTGKKIPAIPGNPPDAGGNAIEAPFIFRKDNYYYLFASIDYCCKGVNSTYKVILGRARKPEGPYLDKAGMDMAKGGGTILLQGDAAWHGVGHNAVYKFDNDPRYYMIFHGYDAADNGKSKLRISFLAWDNNGWPSVVPEEL